MKKKPDLKMDIGERLLDKVQGMDEKVGRIEVDTARNTTNLELHMERTRQNEELIGLLRKDLEPVKKHVAMVDGTFKFIGFAVSLGSLVFGIVKFFFN